MHPFRILIADDDDTHREVLHRYLRLAGYDVVEASNGAEALVQFMEHEPDLVLLDVRMPVLDGFGALRTLREHPRGADVPIIMLTSDNSRHLTVRGLELGAEDYINKPLDRAVLLARVRVALRRAARFRKLESAIEGSLLDVGLHVLLQTLELGQKHALVRLADLDAEIQVAAGILVACRYGSTKGEGALARIILTEHGRFQVDFSEPIADEPPEGEQLTRVLLRVAVDVDEARHTLSRLPLDLEDSVLTMDDEVATWPALAQTRPLTPCSPLELLVRMDGSLADNAATMVAAFEQGALVHQTSGHDLGSA